MNAPTGGRRRPATPAVVTLKDYLARDIEGKELVTDQVFSGKITKPGGHGSLEWAVTWIGGRRLPQFLLQHHPDRRRRHPRGRLPQRADCAGCARMPSASARTSAPAVTTDDVMATCAGMLSVFIREPEFQGQTKDKLATVEAARIVETAIRDAFDHWLAGLRSKPTSCSTG